MPQTSNRILDEFARFVTDAAGVARGVRTEAETAIRTQAEKVLRDLDVVQREEFEAVREMAVRARQENEALAVRLEALERAAGIVPEAAATAKPKAASTRKRAAKPAVDPGI